MKHVRRIAVYFCFIATVTTMSPAIDEASAGPKMGGTNRNMDRGDSRRRDVSEFYRTTWGKKSTSPDAGRKALCCSAFDGRAAVDGSILDALNAAQGMEKPMARQRESPRRGRSDFYRSTWGMGTPPRDEGRKALCCSTFNGNARSDKSILDGFDAAQRAGAR